MILKHQNWLVVSTPLKNMKVSWDDYSIPKMMGKSFKIPWFQSTNQMIIWWFPEIDVPQSSNSVDCVDIHGDLRYQPCIWKNKIHVPNHQPVIVTSGYIYIYISG